MRVLLVGSGGREAALAYRMARSATLTELIVTAPNPGWPAIARLREASADAVPALAVELGVDLVVVGPEAPLAAGLADQLAAEGIACFGPSAAASQLETSKAFCKGVMAEAGVPTADFIVADRDDPASVQAARARCARGNVAIKVDGLAAGKGVFVCPSPEEARQALDEAWSGRFGDAARRLVLEDLMVGPEVSVFALCDGSRAVPLPSAQDHKRIGDGDTGPNTGGMGAYAPCPLLGSEATAELVARVHQPVLDVMAARGTPFRGVLFAGFMLTPNGPRLLEFNVRFGDPETQALMCLWKDDIVPWLYGAAIGQLPGGIPGFDDGAACCVVLASAGYPASSTRGTPIPEPAPAQGVVAFHAGTKRDEAGVLRTDGGRVLGITGVGATVDQARERAYEDLLGWRFDGCQYRSDIAAQAVS